jgi:hypothetical protein
LLEAKIYPDSSVDVYYEMDFRNQPGAHPIDFVDVGLPAAELDFRVIETGRDGEPAASHGPSEYVHPGVAVGLRNPIPPGESGKFYFLMNIANKMIYEDTTRDGYASFQITPTWFGSEYVMGLSEVTVRVVLPPGIKPEEVLYQDVPFTSKEVVDNKVVVEFKRTYIFAQPFRVGVSFPSKNMTGVTQLSVWDMIVQWYEANSRIFHFIFIPLTVFFAGWALIRAGGKGCFPVLILFLFFYFSIGQFFRGCLFLVTLGAAVFVEILRRRKRQAYLPALVSVEGGGVRRGLTAPEAAVMLELPPNRIITMVLFGLLKKGMIRQKETDPLEFEEISPAPENTVLHDYETQAMQILARPSKYPPLKPYPIKERDFGPVIDSIVRSLKPKLKGHDLDETRGYYKHIVSRAWLEAKEVGDVQAWNKKMDEKIDWMMLDNDFEDRFRPYNNRYTPRYSFPSSTASSTGGGGTKSAPPSSGPRITDIAGSMAAWMQNTAGSVVSSVAPKDAPLFDGAKLMKSSGSGGGSGRSGGGSSCACACAGCACACACAGGGR